MLLENCFFLMLEFYLMNKALKNCQADRIVHFTGTGGINSRTLQYRLRHNQHKNKVVLDVAHPGQNKPSMEPAHILHAME